MTRTPFRAFEQSDYLLPESGKGKGPIKAIIFDCFGVLTGDRWHEFTSQLPKGEIVDRARELNRQYCAGKLSTEEFLQAIEKLTGAKASEITKLLNNELGKNYLLLDYIKSLSANYKIGILSNVASGWIRDVFLTEEEQTIFSDILESFTVGVIKPDPRIFDLACKRLGVVPGEVIFVDDIETYCLAAKKLGIKTVLYQNFEQCKKEIEQLLKNAS